VPLFVLLLVTMMANPEVNPLRWRLKGPKRLGQVIVLGPVPLCVSDLIPKFRVEGTIISNCSA
jgi:hypothetical protein